MVENAWRHVMLSCRSLYYSLEKVQYTPGEIGPIFWINVHSNIDNELYIVLLISLSTMNISFINCDYPNVFSVYKFRKPKQNADEFFHLFLKPSFC